MTSFRSRLGALWLLVAGGLFVSGRLAWLGVAAYQLGLYQEGTRWLVGGPLVLSSLVLAGTARLWWLGEGQEVVLGAAGLTCVRHGRRYSARWDTLVVTRGPWQARVSNGEWTVSWDRAYFPQFDALLAAVEERRTRVRERQTNVLAT